MMELSHRAVFCAMTELSHRVSSWYGILCHDGTVFFCVRTAHDGTISGVSGRHGTLCLDGTISSGQQTVPSPCAMLAEHVLSTHVR
jgi:hypothetical protein